MSVEVFMKTGKKPSPAKPQTIKFKAFLKPLKGCHGVRFGISIFYTLKALLTVCGGFSLLETRRIYA